MQAKREHAGSGRLAEVAGASEELWTFYNGLLLGPDLARIRKMLVRYRLFEPTVNVPGDVIECGVFKGAGLMFWAKLLEIFSPGTLKRVIGFDVFGPFTQVRLREAEQSVASDHDALTRNRGVSQAEILAHVEAAGLAHRVALVAGDVTDTAAAYVARTAGTRVALLHLDLDTYDATLAALRAFWPVMSRGGVVILDEYGVPAMGESDAVDEFLAGQGVRPQVVPFAETPTAYFVKP